MLAFHNDAKLQAMVIDQVAAHTKADEIIQGEYWENGKGCFIGCIAHSSDTSLFEKITGFPVMLTKIGENIFEGLPSDIAKGFPQRVITAPRIGADLSLVAWKFLHQIVSDVVTTCGTKETRKACEPAISVLAAKSRGLIVNQFVIQDAYKKAIKAAGYAAGYAAASAASAGYAGYAASAATDVIVYGDASAAASAGYAASAYAKKSARIKQADLLVKLLSEA